MWPNNSVLRVIGSREQGGEGFGVEMAEEIDPVVLAGFIIDG